MSIKIISAVYGLVLLLGLSPVVGCAHARPSTVPPTFVEPAELRSGERLLRVETDNGLLGPGPVFQIQVLANGSVRGAMFGQYRAYVHPGQPADSVTRSWEAQSRQLAEARYGCRGETVYRDGTYLCTNPLGVEQDWAAVLHQLEALGIGLLPPSREQRDLICTDGNGLEVEYHAGGTPVRYSLSDCGVSAAEAKRQAAIWAVLRAIEGRAGSR